MSRLSDKINSYAIETGISFDSTYAFPPAQTGTVTNTNSADWLLSGTAPVYESSVSPAGGGGSWKFASTSSSASRIRNTGTVKNAINDGDYSVGFWIKFNNLDWTGTSNPPLINHQPSTTGGYLIGLLYSSGTGKYNPSLTYGSSSTIVDTTTELNTTDWYYFAITKIGSELKFYVNGVLKDTVTNAQTATATSLNFGYLSQTYSFSSNYANWYIASPSVIGATEIAEIATVGNSENIESAPMTVTALFVDPVVSTQSTIVLSNKILSYSPELYWQFNEAVVYSPFTKPTNLGSYNYGTSAWSTRNTDNITPYLNASGGVRGTGSWVFSYGGSTDSTPPDIRLNTTQSLPLKDGNSSTGYFFKTNFTLSDTFAHDTSYQIVSSGISATSDRNIITAIAGGAASSANKGKAIFTVGGGTTFYSPSRVDDQKWHYVTVRQNQSVSGIYTEVYLDGNLLNAQTVTLPTGTINGSLQIGDSATVITGNGAFEATTFEVSDIHVGTYLSVTSTGISDIFAVAQSSLIIPSGVSVSHTAEPMTANATLPMPTIVAVIGDSVNISTSFEISATFPTPAFGTGQNITINADALTASGVLTDNYILITNRDVEYGAEACLATALLVEPLIAREPLRASATMPGGIASVAPNYFSLVKNLNPVFYIEDGQDQPVEYGTWNVNGFTREYMDVNVQAGEELNVVGNQKCWMANANGVILFAPEIMANITNYETLIENLYQTKTLSIEVWYWSKGFGSINGGFQDSGPIFDDGVTQISEVYDFFGCKTPTEPLEKVVLIADRIKDYDFSGSPETAFAQWRTYEDATPKREAWNHLVVTYEANVDPTKIRRKVYLNGAIVGNELLTISIVSGINNLDISFQRNANTFLGPKLGSAIQISGSQKIKMADGVKVDEFAIYPITLSASQVLDHHAFIRNLSPDTEFNATSFNLAAQMGNHIVTPVQNTVYEVSPMTALAIVRDPVILGGKSKTILAEALEASTILTDPAIYLGITILANAITTYAESPNHFFLNDIYYEYVQATIAPYRYVTFDQANFTADYGIDDDYSVNMTTIGGTVVNPDLGINGRSVLTSGTSYITGGVILNESEWNDTWGTGANSHHSAFWFQRSQEDQSTTGLRVLWNLNGYYDNHHVILYQYQGKLHLQFNNGSGTWIEQSTVNGLDLFDYNPHFVVINFNHTNPNNNIVTVYVDSILRMTINLGTYTGETVNSYTADSGPNDEANNYPRLAVGCLITPFAATALPVVPTNTKLIIDEIYWDKNEVTQTQVTNIYNKLPGKTFSVIVADPMLASALIVTPTFSTEINKAAGVLESLGELLNPIILADKNLSISVDAMLANALIVDSPRSDSIVIPVEFMLASASFNSAGTPKIIVANAMNATALFQNRRIVNTSLTPTNYPIRVQGITTFEPTSAWVRYVNAVTAEILNPMKEVI